MNLQMLPEFAWLGIWLSTIFWAASIVINFLFAAGVARDAGRLEREGGRTELVGGIAWAFATLLGGVFVAAVYWIIHHSALRKARLWSAQPS